MSESVKSAVFVVVAVVVMVVGWIARPATEVAAVQDDAGARFWKKFDPEDIGRMRIVTFDNDSGEAHTFEVANTPDGWVIPSHDNYATDAESKLGEATAAVIDLLKGTVASDSKKDHTELGVVAPSEYKAGTTGVGTRITLEDKNGEKLADIVVGKEDKNGAKVDDPLRPSDQSIIRFVRQFPQDRVYRAKLDLSKLSTKFEDWIETDLLKLNSQQVKQVLIDNYSLQVILDQQLGQMRLTIEQIEKLLLGYNRQDTKWTIRQYLFDSKTRDFVEHPFDELNDELNIEKLNEMRNALGDLKIVDVRRKPDVVSANLRAKGQMTREVAESMLAAGFLANPDGEFFSKQGDMFVGMEDGVEYVLRFGNVVEARTGKKLNEGENEDDIKLEDLTRYLLVTARFNKDLIPPPDLQPLPDVADQPAQPPAGNGQDEVKPPKSDDAKADDAKVDDKQDPAAKEPEKKETEPTPEQAARKKIEESNKKLQEEYDQKLKDGQERADKLNRRFADWYYIISDEEFKKIRLRREEIIKAKEPKGQGNLPGDFDALKQGLKKGLPKSEPKDK